MIAVLRLGTIFVGLPGVQTLAVPSAGHPAGCHSHCPAPPLGLRA